MDVENDSFRSAMPVQRTNYEGLCCPRRKAHSGHLLPHLHPNFPSLREKALQMPPLVPGNPGGFPVLWRARWLQLR